MKTATALVALLATGALGGCAETIAEVSPLKGPPVQSTTTPYDSALACLKQKLPRQPELKLAIGTVKDRTGKYNYDEGSGFWVTQGAADMLSTALYDAGSVRLVERVDTKVLEWELKMAYDKVLGDGVKRPITTKEGKRVEVDYRAVPAGGIMGSDYYIAGSINSLDLAVNSMGASVGVSGIGPRARAFSMIVGLDLRVVATRTGDVVAATSVNKRIVGDEVGAGIGRFFGTTLVEFDAGMKRQEPLHLALRSMLYLATYNLLTQVYDVDGGDCAEGIAKLEGVEEARVPASVSKPQS